MEFVQAWARDSRRDRIRLWEKSGFKLVRKFSLMKRDLDAVPSGIGENKEVTLTPLRKNSDEDVKMLTWLGNECFKEHFNYRPGTIEQTIYFLRKDPFFKDQEWFFAMLNRKHVGYIGAGIDEKYPIEGREKFDLKKFSEVIRETFRQELPNILREIDISDPKYVKVEVLILPKREMRQELAQKVTKIERKEMMIERSKFIDAMKDLIVSMKNLQNYDFESGYVLEEGEESFLYRINGKYFLLKVVDLEMLINKIFEKLKMFARAHA